MACSLKDAEEMEATAKRNGRILMIGMTQRYRNDVQTLLEFRESSVTFIM